MINKVHYDKNPRGFEFKRPVDKVQSGSGVGEFMEWGHAAGTGTHWGSGNCTHVGRGSGSGDSLGGCNKQFRGTG